jgi:7-cyano-7-deazaguanine synthase
MKALVLHSGGLDSSLCLLKAIAANREVISLGIDYGQQHRIELEYALAQCRKYSIERRLLRVEWDKPLRVIPIRRSPDEIRNGVSPAFLPGRNALFLTLACAEAAGVNAKEVWIGVNAVDFSGYPDCRPEFIDAFKIMIKKAIPNGPEIVAPLIDMSKPDIASEAFRLGLRHGDTWSCYQPRFTESGISPCGECDACILHEYAWQQVKGGKDSVQ